MARAKRQRKLVAIAGLLLAAIIIIVVLVLLRSHAQANAVFTIDGRAYGEKEVKDITSLAVKGGESQDQAAKEAFYYLKRQHVAEKMGIKIDDEAVNKQIDDLFGKNNQKAKDSKWAKLVAYNDVLISRLDNLADNANVSGYVYIFFFGQQIERGPAYTPPYYGNKAIIARDKAYAKQQADDYHKALDSSKLTPEAAFKKLEADARLGWFNKKNSNPSGRFEGSDLVDYPDGLPVDAANYLNSKNIQKGLSNIKIGNTPANTTIDKPEANEFKPTYYYFTLVKKLDRSQSRSKFNSDLKNLSAHYTGFKKESKK